MTAWLVILLACVGGSRAMYDTIVVGAGAAGCTAAATLARAGRRVLLLEAQSRVGGRVHTAPFGDGVVELGAEWIHGTHPSRVYDLAMENNIDIINQTLDFELYMSDGTPGNKELINELMEFAMEAIEDPPAVPESVGQYITRRVKEYVKEKHPHIANDTEFIDSFLYFMDLVIDNLEASNSWNDVTTKSDYEDLQGHQYASWHRHGYKTFFEILLNTYNNGPGLPTLQVLLGKEVSVVTWPREPAGHVTVTCADGSVHTARDVIVTVSLGVLKERHTTLFPQKLPTEKTAAIEHISMGVIGKVILTFPYYWWPDGDFKYIFWTKSDRDELVHPESWISTLPGVSRPTGCRNCVTFWTRGDTTKHKKLFRPSLPAEKIKAIESISMGCVDKIVLYFDKAWWPPGASMFGFLWDARHRSEGTDDWTTKIYAASCPIACGSAMTLWTSGECAALVETLPEDVVRTKVMALLRRFMGRNTTIPEPTAILRSTWHSNPFTRGSYTYDNVLTPLYPTARVDLAAPVLDSAGTPRVLFAGEATNPKHHSTVHGAAESGYREAERLLNVHSKI